MKVRELIEKLQQCPPNDTVMLIINDYRVGAHIESVRFGDETPEGITVLEDYPID